LEEKQKPRGWGVPSLGQLLGWLASPVGALAGFPGLGRLPRWLAWPIRALVAALLVFLLYMVELGLFALFRLGNEIVFSPTTVSTSGSLTVFFSALLALVGGPLLIWRVVTAHVQAQAARHQAEAARRQADIAQEGQYTALFTKAVEQLGATREVKKTVEAEGKRELVTDTEPNLEVRLGAIYALERIAIDSERDHWPIMEVLCAYVRNSQNCGQPVQRPPDLKIGSLDFRMWRESIKQPRVDIQSALTVIGQRPPERVLFERHRGLTLDLSGANLQRAKLNGRFARANLSLAHLECARFEGGDFESASFDEAHLEAARLKRKAHFERALFTNAHLEGATLLEGHFEGAVFFGARLNRAIVRKAHLKGAALLHADLEGASLENAHLEDVSFSMASLKGTRLFDTDLSKVKALDPWALASAFGDGTTTLPEGALRPKDWSDEGLNSTDRRKWMARQRAKTEKQSSPSTAQSPRAPPVPPIL
jgi:hypothetical protein